MWLAEQRVGATGTRPGGSRRRVDACALGAGVDADASSHDELQPN